jgi:hypothetical protein
MSPTRKTLEPNPIARIASEGPKTAESAAILDCSDGTLEQGFACASKKGAKTGMRFSGEEESISGLVLLTQQAGLARIPFGF